jgi:hypothetical protein
MTTLMQPGELAFVQLARRIGAMAQHASALYGQAQAALQLDQLLLPERMATAEGTRRSLDTLAELRTLHEQHKKMFAAFTTAAMAQFRDALAAMPAAKAREYQQGLIGSLEARLAGQARFYEDRDEWIATAIALFTLVDEQRGAFDIAGGAIAFDDDALADRYNALLDALEAIHQREVASFRDNTTRALATNAFLDAVERGAARP